MIILLFIPLLWSNTPVSAQSEDAFLEKYQYYQERFYEDFIYYSADNPFSQGSSLPVEYRRLRTDGKVLLYWADGVWWLGHYVGMLAMEYQRLKLTMQDTLPTLRKLQAALATYKRLDYVAESCWNDTSTSRELNGFYLRDDITDEIKKKLKADILVSDYIRYCGKIDSKGNAPSHDQAWGSYIGLALVKKFVPIPEIQNEVKEIATLLVRGMQQQIGKKKRWEIINPVTNQPIQKQADIGWLRYAHTQMGNYLTEEDMTFARSDTQFWKDMWRLLQNNILIDKYGNFNWYGVLSISAVLNDHGRGEKNCYDWLIKRTEQIVKKRPDLEQSMIFPHLPLVNVLLHGYEGNKPLPKTAYEAYLEAAPEEGAFYYVINDSIVRSTPPWHSLSFFCPWHNRTVGEYNMLDYMFLYNAYWLVYCSDLEQVEKFRQEPLDANLEENNEKYE